MNTALSRFIKEPEITASESIPGFPVIQLYLAKYNSRASVHLYGAHVTHFESAGKNILFLSEKAAYATGKAIRGGIPICWPQFSGQGNLPAHGLVRNRLWEVRSSGVDSEGGVQVEFGISHNAETLALWPHEFELLYTVRLTKSLTTELKIINRGVRPFAAQLALHTYFAVSDIQNAEITGLHGLEIADYTRQSPLALREDRASVTIGQWTDRIYKGTPEALTLIDKGTRSVVTIHKEHLADSVVWNPWIEKSAGLNDLDPEAYKRFLCIESGQIHTPFVVLPGEFVTSRQTIEARELF